MATRPQKSTAAPVPGQRRRSPGEDAPEWLDVPSAARYLSLSERMVRRLIQERRIAFHHFGRHVRLNQADLDAWAAQGRQEAMR